MTMAMSIQHELDDLGKVLSFKIAKCRKQSPLKGKEIKPIGRVLT